MATPVRVLIVEDRPADAELMVAELRRAGFAPQWGRVDSEADYVAHLTPPPDVILCDYILPQFGGRRALQILQAQSADVPFIVVSGTIGEEMAVTFLKEGAWDYLLKDRLDRLGPAVERALREKQLRDARRQAEAALRESEQRLALIYDSVTDVIFLIAVESSDTFRFVSVNAAFLSATGLAAEEVVGKRVEEVISEASHALVLSNYRTAIREKRRVNWEEVSVYPAGRTVGEVTVVPIFDPSGACTHLIGAVHDVTAAREMQEMLQVRADEVRQMAQQLWHVAKLATVGELAASVAHELNNPLTTILLRIESLQAQTPAESPIRTTLQVIEQEADRMGTLVANLLEFSRRRPMHISTLDVREEVRKTLELVSYHLRSQRVAVVEEFASDLRAVHADRQQLRQVFLNLITNASDAMPDGGTLTLRVRGVEKPAGVVVEVADTGAGIAAEDLLKVLEPFYTTKPEGLGTGLGLAICRRIVEAHQGRLEIDSEVGRGTTVRIVLPPGNERNPSILANKQIEASDDRAS